MTQVKGTPGSGKTTLGWLLCNYIVRESPRDRIAWFKGWPEDHNQLNEPLPIITEDGVTAQSLAALFTRQSSGFTWLVFDEAQDSYCDTVLWNYHMKDVRGGVHPEIRVVCLEAFGSPSSRSSRSTTRMFGTPELVTASYIMPLRPSPESPHALAFTEDEFNSYMDLLSTFNERPVLQNDLKEYIYNTSAGHIGAITALLKMAAMAAVRSSSSCVFQRFTVCLHPEGTKEP